MSSNELPLTVITPPEPNAEHVNPISRREMLLRAGGGLLALAAVIATGGSSSAPGLTRDSQLSRLEAADDYPYEPPAPEETYYAPRHALAVASNARLKAHLPNRGIAYAVTHAGFTDKHTGSIKELLNTRLISADNVGKYLRAREGAFGDYESYRAGLVELLARLRVIDAPVLCFTETEDVANPRFPRPELQPPENAFLLQTQRASGTLADTVRVRDPVVSYVDEKQQPNLLYAALHTSGVKEIRVAGEYGNSLFYPDALACLGSTTLQLMEAGFKVKGIESAIFPPEDPGSPLPDGHWSQDVFYGTAMVPLSEVR